MYSNETITKNKIKNVLELKFEGEANSISTRTMPNIPNSHRDELGKVGILCLIKSWTLFPISITKFQLQVPIFSW